MKKVRRPKVKPYQYRDHAGNLRKTFMVYWYDQFDKRQRQQFKDRQEANSFAENKYTELLNQGLQRKVLSTVLTEETLREAELAIGRLDGRYDIKSVVDFFILHHHNPTEKISLVDTITKFLTFQETRISEASYREFRNTLNNFAKFANNPYVHEVSLETVEGFLTSLRAKGGVDAASGKTWENNRKSLHRFFNWCMARPQLFITLNPTEHATRKDDSAQNEIHSLNAERAEQLMRYVEDKYPQLVPRFAIALFAGVRPNGEMDRLSEKSNAIRLENGIINLTGDVTKTGETRHVKIQPNLQAWLQRYGINLSPANAKQDITAVRRQFGLNEKKWHDCLRHSFISAHAQFFGSFMETALESGNSERIIRQRYFNTLTTKEDAGRFWQIYPTTPLSLSESWQHPSILTLERAQTS